MIKRRKFIKTATAASLTPALPAFANTKTKVTASVNPTNYVDYMNMLDGQNAIDVHNVAEFENLNRHNLEIWLFEKIVHKGLPDFEFTIDSYSLRTNFARTVSNVRAGAELTHPVAGFDKDPRYDHNFHLSDPILSGDDFYVGLFTPSHRTDILNMTDETEIKNLRVSCARNWMVDRAVISSYGFDPVLADDWGSIMSLLKLERADVILQPFSANNDMGFADDESGMYLKPIPNIKMRFGAGRCYIVSSQHELGQITIDGINEGIKLIDQDNFIQKAHMTAGIIDERTVDFKVIFGDVDLNSN